MDQAFKQIREEAYAGNMELPKNHLVVATFGNVSAADHSREVFAIKPSGVAYEALSAEKMVIVGFDGNVVEGDLRPSSDTLTHAVLYTHWNDVGGIVHTHSTYATAWAQAVMDIPILGTTHADHTTRNIPCAPPMDNGMIQGNYEYETGFQVMNALKERNITHHDVEMVLVGSHAPFTWGENAAKAVYNSIVLEAIAKMALLTLQIHPNSPLLKDALIEKHYQRKHGKNAYYGQN